ncbi:Chaperone DnaJ-domain superfamily protein [Tripterygium wilfordii]|uniref:Chaperone DnaJ-domain superfamily protein n=1 Tax=Tripterygium wilfordii TaxID=458696 RepID=A0A7J7C3U6_TRIWF|nr:Chaperone DnaJ-domain superfamily protein [Tripterygium wilfordii]
MFLLISLLLAIYCDEDDCYDTLSVSQNANTSEIKKAYYKLFHRNKNPDPESKKLFVKIVNAYGVLKDEAMLEQYDYAIAHPEEVHYFLFMFLFDPCAVLVGLLLILSAFQYLNQQTRYNQIKLYHKFSIHRKSSTAAAMVKKTPAYRNRLWTLELERSGGIASRKKEEDLSLDIKGAEKPSMWDIIGVTLYSSLTLLARALKNPPCETLLVSVSTPPSSVKDAWLESIYKSKMSMISNLFSIGVAIIVE